MPTTTTNITIDANSNHDDTNQDTGGYERLYCRSDATNHGRRIYIYVPKPFSTGVTVSQAILHLFVGNLGSGLSGLEGQVGNIQWRRLSTSWKESGTGHVSWSNPPGDPGVDAGSIAVGGLAPGTHVQCDVTTILQQAANGSAFYGIRIATTIDNLFCFWSSEHSDADTRPFIEIVWGDAPNTPYDLIPLAGLVVGSANPILNWQFEDSTGLSAQSAYQVQISTLADFSVITHDTDWFTTSETQHSLAADATKTNATYPAGYTGFNLVAGTTYYWRVRVQDQLGKVSAYSDGASFVYRAKGTLAFTGGAAGLQTSTHAAPTSLNDPTPPLTTTFTPPAGKAQDMLEYVLQEADASISGAMLSSYHDILVLPAQAISTNPYTYTPPSGYITKTNWNYRIIVRAYDNYSRIATPGVPIYVESNNAGATNGYFKYVGNAAAAIKVTNTAVAQGASPVATITWTYTGVPTRFVLEVDGRVETIEIGDSRLTSVGNNYTLLYSGLRPGYAHTISVHATTTPAGSPETTAGDPVVNFTPTVEGIWLIRVSTADKVWLRGNESPRMRLGESSTIYTPVGRRDPVKIVDAVRGYEGTLVGSIVNSGVIDGQTMTAVAQRDRLEVWRGITNEDFRLVFGTFSFRVRFGEIDVTQDGTVKNKYDAEIEFFQVNDFTFDIQ